MSGDGLAGTLDLLRRVLALEQRQGYRNTAATGGLYRYFQDHFGKHEYDVATWAVEQLKSPPKGPFFLAVGLRHPHVPCYAPPKWFDLYPDATLQMPRVKDDDRDDPTPAQTAWTTTK